MQEISDNKGISAVMINSGKGRKIFAAAEDAVNKFPCTQSDVAKKQPNMSTPSSYSNKAQPFNEDLKRLPFADVLKKYTRVGFIRIIIDLIKKILGR